MNVCAVDPGLNGAIAMLSRDGLIVERMPTYRIDGKGHLNLQEICCLFREWAPGHIFIERQQAMPGQGVSSTFKTGFGYGVLAGICAGLRFPVTEVAPVVWKRALSVPADKDGARMRASQVFPDSSYLWGRKSDDGVAEAALIAEYGRRTLGLPS